MRDANSGNGLLLKIALAISAALCSVLLGLILNNQSDTSATIATQGERLARLEAKVDMLLRKVDQ